MQACKEHAGFCSRLLPPPDYSKEGLWYRVSHYGLRASFLTHVKREVSIPINEDS